MGSNRGAMTLYGLHVIHFGNILATGGSFFVALKTGKTASMLPLQHWVAPLIHIIYNWQNILCERHYDG